MATIKNIIFDLGGVIIDLDPQRCFEAFAQVGIADADTLFKSPYANDFWRAAEVDGLSTVEFCALVRSLSATTVSDEDIVWAWNRFLVGTTQARRERILALGKAYRVFLLSNTNEMHWNYTAQELLPYGGHGASDFFESVFLSYEMHLAKPQPEIFEETLRQAGLRAEETLFIDDRLENCEAAELVGIKTYHNVHIDDWLTASAVPLSPSNTKD